MNRTVRRRAKGYNFVLFLCLALQASSNEAMSSEALVQAAASQVAVSQAIAQAVASHAVGNTDEPYSAEVAAIVQTVVSAHMDEVLAARNYQGNECKKPN